MRTVVFGVLHPHSAQYAREWYSAMARQKTDFDICLALDGVTAPSYMYDVAFRTAKKGVSPVAVRQWVIRELCYQYEAIVLMDLDDIPKPGLISTAKTALKDHHAYIWSLQGMDSSGELVESVNLTVPSVNIVESVFDQNFLGFGNTAFRCDSIQDMPDLPHVEIADWPMALWVARKNMLVCQDRRKMMRYRLGGLGLPAKVTPEAVLSGARLVSQCWNAIEKSLPGDEDVRVSALRYRNFFKQVARPRRMREYMRIVRNYERDGGGWWWHIAHIYTMRRMSWGI